MNREVMVWSLLFGILVAPAPGKPNVYVVDFTARNLQKSAITAKFTYDFEQALVQSGCYSVLESRNFARLHVEAYRERAIADISQLSESTLSRLRAKQAEMVVFGEVFDDIDSGQINITVTFQKFDRTKVLIKSALLSRGKANDAESRQAAMASLTEDLCSSRLKETGRKTEGKPGFNAGRREIGIDGSVPEDLKLQQLSLVKCFEGIIENMGSMFAADRRSARGDWAAYLEVNSLMAEMNASTSCMSPYPNYIGSIIEHASNIGRASTVDEIDACFRGIGVALSDSQRLDGELRRAYQAGVVNRSHFESAYASALNVMKYMKRCVEKDYFY